MRHLRLGFIQTELQHAGSAFNNLIGEVRVNQAALGIVPDESTDLWTSESFMSVQLDRAQMFADAFGGIDTSVQDATSKVFICFDDDMVIVVL